MSIPRALLLVIALLQATGIIDLVRREVCQAECEGDGCQDCTPGTDGPCACHCPTGATVATPTIAVMSVTRIGETIEHAFDHADRQHLSPDPREILHVPRLRTV